jgi:hypothetical protein
MSETLGGRLNRALFLASGVGAPVAAWLGWLDVIVVCNGGLLTSLTVSILVYTSSKDLLWDDNDTLSFALRLLQLIVLIYAWNGWRCTPPERTYY